MMDLQLLAYFHREPWRNSMQAVEDAFDNHSL